MRFISFNTVECVQIFFLDPPHTFNLIDSLPTKLPCTTTDTLTIQNIEPTTNNQHQISRSKKKESKMKM